MGQERFLVVLHIIMFESQRCLSLFLRIAACFAGMILMGCLLHHNTKAYLIVYISSFTVSKAFAESKNIEQAFSYFSTDFIIFV